MDSRSACIQCVLKVKVKVKDHVIRALSWILGMSYSVIDGLVYQLPALFRRHDGVQSRSRSRSAHLVHVIVVVVFIGSTVAIHQPEQTSDDR